MSGAPRRRESLLACALIGVGCGGSDGGSATPKGPIDPPLNDRPTALFTAPNLEGIAPLTVELDASGSMDSDGSVTAYSWALGDGTTATGVQVTHVYEEPGDYTIQLTVTDDAGATGSSATWASSSWASASPTSRARFSWVRSCTTNW